MNSQLRRDIRYMVIDVESIGLYGEGFAVGGGIYSFNEPPEEFLFHCHPGKAMGSHPDRLWVANNVPTLGRPTHETPENVRAAFLAKWIDAKDFLADLWVDCGYPVETRFLDQSVSDYLSWTDPGVREEYGVNIGPYPLHEIATITLAAGMDPLKLNDRLPDELPKHNPLHDARQSCRLLREAIMILTK